MRKNTRLSPSFFVFIKTIKKFEVITLLRSKTKKKLRIAGITGLTCAVIAGGAFAINHFGLYKFGKTKPEEVKYEIGGKNTNLEVRNSIIGGSGLNQFLKGADMEECLSDADGNVYKYEDENGVTWVYENQSGKIFCVDQQLKYDEKTWNEIKSFWKTLGNKDRTYTGYDELEASEIDWDDEKIDMSLTGSNEEFEYSFNRYQNYAYELEDGSKEGFDGTAMSVRISSLEGDNDDRQEENN